VPLGTGVRRGDALARVHAATAADAERGAAAFSAALQITDTPQPIAPLVHKLIDDR